MVSTFDLAGTLDAFAQGQIAEEPLFAGLKESGRLTPNEVDSQITESASQHNDLRLIGGLIAAKALCSRRNSVKSSIDFLSWFMKAYQDLPTYRIIERGTVQMFLPTLVRARVWILNQLIGGLMMDGSAFDKRVYFFVCSAVSPVDEDGNPYNEEHDVSVLTKELVPFILKTLEERLVVLQPHNLESGRAEIWIERIGNLADSIETPPSIARVLNAEWGRLIEPKKLRDIRRIADL